MLVVADNLAPHWRNNDPVDEARRIIELAIKLYRPAAVWCLCSGGNDSLCSTHVAMSTGLATGVVSINTTIGIQATRDHTAAVCQRFGWPLRWLTPETTYKDFCARFGMPGPGRHDYVYRYLKERPVDQLVRESKRRRQDMVMLVTGVRLGESERRMGNANAIARDGRTLWTGPIINWTPEDQVIYMTSHGIPRNPVKPVLGISGECLCGAFAKPDERKKIAASYPDAFAHILECESAAAENQKPCRWGTRPKERRLCQQCDRKAS
jgi:3'-phosphoadenosine 5'-phosphosulfate sulfotransferase (PAPS reductase)/FAD synthetase